MIILRQIKIQQLNIAKVLITNCQFYTTKKIENLKSKTPKKLEFENIKIDKSILTTFKLIDSVSPLSSKPKKKSTSKEKGKEKEKFSFGNYFSYFYILNHFKYPNFAIRRKKSNRLYRRSMFK